MQGLPLLLYNKTCSNRDRGRIRNISQDVVKIFLEKRGSLTTYIFWRVKENSVHVVIEYRKTDETTNTSKQMN